MKKLELKIEQHDEEYYETKDQLKKLQDERIDNKLQEIVQKFNGLKVVVVEFCTY